MSERPTVRKTWSLKGKTPVIQSTGSWKNLSLLATITCAPQGRKPNLFLKSQPGSVKASDVIDYLKELKKHLSGKKLLLFWDGLPAHRAILVKNYLEREKSWLKVVRMPAYAPELNPPEYLWSSMKTKDICNLRPDGLKTLKKAVRKGYRRVKRQPDLIVGFLKASRLF